jgi:hypothetical protein
MHVTVVLFALLHYIRSSEHILQPSPLLCAACGMCTYLVQTDRHDYFPFVQLRIQKKNSVAFIFSENNIRCLEQVLAVAFHEHVAANKHFVLCHLPFIPTQGHERTAVSEEPVQFLMLFLIFNGYCQ